MSRRRLRALLSRWRYPAASDTPAVVELTAQQWRGISRRTPTYLEGYRDRPGSEDRAQRRARYIAALPQFRDAASVLEIGCGAGRTLCELRRRYPALALHGLDINADAVAAARTALPSATLTVGSLYTPGPLPAVDLVLSCGVLVHLAPETLTEVLARLLVTARQGLVLVEEDTLGEDRVVKGPAAWGAEQDHGDYVLWRVNLLRRIPKGVGIMRAPLPADLVAPGASHVLVVTKPTENIG